MVLLGFDPSTGTKYETDHQHRTLSLKMATAHSHGEQMGTDEWMQTHASYWKGKQTACLTDIKIAEYFQTMKINYDEHCAGKT